MVLPQLYTPDMVRALPDDGNRYETVYGELLVTPAPRFRHNSIGERLFLALHQYCEAAGVGSVHLPPADISLTPDSLVQPDVYVIPPIGEPDPDWGDLPRPILIGEVLSPSTARADRFTKRVHYQRSGIPVYWIIDEKHRMVEVWRPDAITPETVTGILEWEPTAGKQPFQIAVDELLR